jgi:hypothetical protein
MRECRAFAARPALGLVLLSQRHSASRNLDRSLEMSKNKLLIAITAGLFAATGATGAFAQTSSGNSSNATAAPTAGPAQDDSAGTMTKPKKAKHHHTSSHAPSTGKKTPDQTTAGGAAGTENGQGK